jgi:hypothetical protein
MPLKHINFILVNFFHIYSFQQQQQKPKKKNKCKISIYNKLLSKKKKREI